MSDATGTIIWFNEKKGYGFIKRDDGLKDIFVHANACKQISKDLEEGDRVEFDIDNDRGKSKLKAIHVKLI